MFIVESIPMQSESHELVKKLEKELLEQKEFNKPMNGNLAIVKDGVVIKCHKGTSEEVNNAMLDTYHLHTQDHPNVITKRLERDYWLKLVRSARFILSFYSRTERRLEIKKALRGDATKRLEELRLISISEMEIIGKKEKLEDVYKVMAFQFAQCMGLSGGEEIYTKEDAYKTFPQLKPFLMRDKDLDLKVLDRTLEIFMVLLEIQIPKHLDKLIEYDI
jgi:hypothetical protein